MDQWIGIQGLPKELLLDILKDLPISDLKALRLASRFFKPTVDTILFSSVTFSKQKLDQNNFESISKHQEYRMLVKELRFNTIYPLNITKKNFKSLCEASGIKNGIKKIHEDYDDAIFFYAAQNTFELSSQLASGFRLMPNIRSILIVQDHKRASWLRRFPFLLSGYEIWDPSKTCHLYWADEYLLHGGMDPQIFRIIDHAISSSGANIQKLSVDQDPDPDNLIWYKSKWLTGEYVVSDSITGSRNLFMTGNYLKSLVDLSFTFTGCIKTHPPLYKLLKECPALRQLDLDFHAKYDDLLERTHSDLGEDRTHLLDNLRFAFVPFKTEEGTRKKYCDIGEPLVIPSLKKLSLSNVSTTGSTLMRILKSHKLKTLCLRNTYDYGFSSATPEKDWECVLDMVRSMKLDFFTFTNVSGFIRNISGATVDPPKPISLRQVFRLHAIDSRVIKVWSALPLYRGDMPEGVERIDLGRVCSQIRQALDPRRRKLRERIVADQIQLDPSIMEYATGRSSRNPLEYLSLYNPVYQFDDYFLQPGVLDEFKTEEENE